MKEVIRRSLNRLVLRFLTDKFVVGDFNVVVINTRADVRSEHVIQRLGEAITLIRTFIPVHYRHATRDIAEIRIDRQPVRGYFDTGTRTCVLDLMFLIRSDFSIQQLAGTFLHESMHARLHARGFEYTPETAARHERFCRRAELKFGLLVPGGEDVANRAQAYLDSPDEVVAPDIDWRGGHRRAFAEDVEALDAPEWLKRRMLKRLDRRDRKA